MVLYCNVLLGNSCKKLPGVVLFSGDCSHCLYGPGWPLGQKSYLKNCSNYENVGAAGGLIRQT